MKIAYVVDSTVQLSDNFASKNSILTVPLYVNWDGVTYKDDIDITRQQFYLRMVASNSIPKTSAPSPKDFLDAYNELLEDFDHVVSLHIGDKLSGTYNVATIAAGMAGKDKVTVLDSNTVSAPAGIVLEEVAEYLENGGSTEGLQQKVSEITKNITIKIHISNLDYLYRNGRIGKAGKIFAELLKVRPILSIIDGEIECIDRLMGGNKLPEYIANDFEQLKASGKEIKYIRAVYTFSKDYIHDVKIAAKKHFPQADMYVDQLTPVIGCHSGPMAMAWAYY